MLVERHGIDREWFSNLMKEVGYTDVNCFESFHLTKHVEREPGEWDQQKPKGDNLAKMDFPFLLCCGKKPV